MSTELARVFGEVKEQKGPRLAFLSMALDQQSDGSVELSMKHLTDEILEGVEGTAASPALANSFDLDVDSSLLNEERRVFFRRV